MSPKPYASDDPDNPARLRRLYQGLTEDAVLLGHRRLAAYRLFGEGHVVYEAIDRASRHFVSALTECRKLVDAADAAEEEP